MLTAKPLKQGIASSYRFFRKHVSPRSFPVSVLIDRKLFFHVIPQCIESGRSSVRDAAPKRQLPRFFFYQDSKLRCATFSWSRTGGAFEEVQEFQDSVAEVSRVQL